MLAEMRQHIATRPFNRLFVAIALGLLILSISACGGDAPREAIFPTRYEDDPVDPDSTQSEFLQPRPNEPKWPESFLPAESPLQLQQRRQRRPYAYELEHLGLLAKGGNIGGDYGSGGGGPGPIGVSVPKLTADDPAGGAQFGWPVAISGNTAVIGMTPALDLLGAAYIFQSDGGSWSPVEKLTASAPAPGDWFGRSVAISGNIVVVGAAYDSGGVAYIFERNEGGTDNWGWMETLSTTESNDLFGSSVAISGDTVVVGAYTDDGSNGDCNNCGAAHIFERNEGGTDNWGRVTKLTAGDAAPGDSFGESVAISEDTVVIGAPGADDGGTNSGAAYIFEKPGTGWPPEKTHDAKLTISGAAAQDDFGSSVAISGDTVVVGGFLLDAAYIFEKPGTGWPSTKQEDAKLIAGDMEAGDNFGVSVAIIGDIVVVGAHGDDHGDVWRAGAAYAFVKPTEWGWPPEKQDDAKLTATDAANHDVFGRAIAISEDAIIVGAPGDDDEGTNSGSVYVLSPPESSTLNVRAFIEGRSPPIVQSDTSNDKLAGVAGNDKVNGGPGKNTAVVLAHSPDTPNFFPNPSALRGLTFRQGKLWGVTSGEFGGTGPGVLYEMDADDGTILSTVTISPLPGNTFGLGFDTSRDVFIVTDPTDDVILKVNPTTGDVIDSFASPGSGPVGAAYDATRDGYWVSDFETNRVYLINPDTGAKITSLPAPPGASRIAGTGYDPFNDVILLHSRDSVETYLIRASDGARVGVFPIPPFLAANNGQGAAIRPTDLTGHLAHFEAATISVIDLGPPAVWSDVCVPQRMEITGIGMGDYHYTINPQTLSLLDPASVNWLRAQVAGYGSTTPESVAFTTDAPQSVTLSEPITDTPHGYTFEANLQPTGQVTASVRNPGGSYRTPRGLILYSKRATPGAWTSVGKITNSYVHRDSHSEVLTFPPLAQATDLYITAAVIDNDDDARPMVLEAAAGDVTDSVTELGPTDGDGLNIVNLTLPQVPAGTDHASVTLRSPSENGDSLLLVGLNASYPCGAILHVDPDPATIPLGATGLLTVAVTPGPAEVNGVQVHGQVDPTYLHLLDVRPSGVLTTEIVPPGFVSATGVFSYSAGLLGDVITEPFPVLVLEVQALATTNGTWVEFLDDFPPTDVSGPEGSVLSQAQDGLVIVTPPPTLRGAVDMQGRPPKPAPPWAVPLTVWLTSSGDGTPTHTFTTTTDQNGEFGLYLDGVIPGLYDVRVKGNHTLRNLARDVSLVSGDNPYFLGRLLEGDVETVATFNQVRQADADMLIGSFNLCQDDPGFVANADLDESNCVLLPDFGLLSGNFGKEGDIVITPTTRLRSGLRQASGGGAVIAFNVKEMEVTVGEIVNLTLDVDPRGQPVNGGMVHLRFDPAVVEVVDVTLTERLPLVLEEPLVDNEQGVVRFAAGTLGQTITERFSIATLSLRVKVDTTGTTITPVDAVPPTDVSGPAGSVLAETRGVTLRTETQGGTEHTVYLPIVMK